MLLRPLPPFRAKPSRKPLAPKTSSEGRKDGEDVSVKARRVPVKFPRPTAPPALKVLSR